MAKTHEIKETPLMKQYNEMKANHPDALILFRVGDFYETFAEDAVKASRILGITLTKRANGSASHVALAGFPYHSLDTYLPRLVSSGERVAICEQLEDPKLTKTIVKRGITELITPGTVVDEKVLKGSSNNYLASLHFGKEYIGLSLLDVSTGEFLVCEGFPSQIFKVLSNYHPSEIIYSRSKKEKLEELISDAFLSYALDDYLFEYQYNLEKVLKHYNIQSLKGFGVDDLHEGVISSGIILHYLNENKLERLSHIAHLRRITNEDFIWLDSFTVKNLELIEPLQSNGKSLWQVMNLTSTPMGTRLLKRWILMPLRQLDPILERQSATKFFIEEEGTRVQLQNILSEIGDMERLVSKISLMKANPREVIALKNALITVEKIVNLLTDNEIPTIQTLKNGLCILHNVIDRISTTLSDDPPANIQKGNVIKTGANQELDEYKMLSTSGKDVLLKIQQKEAINTGITSLKIGFNNVFGYYLEVSNVHKSKVPQEWIRKQTLTGAERYVTLEIKEYEEKILTAEDSIASLERQEYDKLLHFITQYIQQIQANAIIIAQLDCFVSLALAAINNDYSCPEMDESLSLELTSARHPVIEKNLPIGESYISNNLLLNDENQQIIIITGPNMSGKSAILRQTALITIMAQMGSFVPAERAKMGIVDKIFTRVGASDNLSAGESTFMVEMIEAANILNNLTQRSLVILDEIGRGTSTYDGISIAWAITEYLHNHPYKPKTLFATHYHELNEINKGLHRVANFHVSIKETGNKILFLRKLVEGGSEHSYGIHVAKIAGVPNQVINRANVILKQLEESRTENGGGGTVSIQPQYQLNMFEAKDTASDVIKKEIQSIDINTITPVEALMKLHHIKNLLKKVGQ